MFELGAGIDCAMMNNIFGATTADRFNEGYASYYMYWTIGQFVYYVFAKIWVLLALPIIPFVGGILLQFYLLLSDYAFMGTTLYLTNSAFEAFHPTVAPELSFTAPAYGEPCFDWSTFTVFETA